MQRATDDDDQDQTQRRHFDHHTRIWAVLLGVVVGATPAAVAAPPAAKSAPDPMRFWDTPRRGANMFSTEPPTAETWRAARAAGIEWVRLAPTKWTGVGPDFLIGDAGDDVHTPVPAEDLKQLKRSLDLAHQAGVRVVVTTLTLPGARWRQHNGGKFDHRLWRDVRFHDDAAQVWVDIARALAGHPALVGYDLLNEPAPERATGLRDWAAPPAVIDAWRRRVAGSPADLALFYDEVVGAIRRVDKTTPILVESGFHAQPVAFRWLRPVRDPRVLYSFHLYEPWVLTSHRNEGRYRYPGEAPYGEEDAKAILWNKAALGELLDVVVAWSKKHKIDRRRVVVGELGIFRQNRGADRYLADAFAVCEARGFHWAFYAFRDDDWHGMDYELGPGPLPPGYWVAREEGRDIAPRTDNPLWRVVTRALRAGRDKKSGPR